MQGCDIVQVRPSEHFLVQLFTNITALKTVQDSYTNVTSLKVNWFHVVRLSLHGH